MNCTKNAIRVVVMLLGIVMLMGLSLMSVSAEGGVKAALGSASVDYATGNTVEIPVNITENSGFVSIQLDVSYDSESLKLTGWKEGEIFPYSGSATVDADKRNANNYTAYSAQDFASNPFRIMYTDGDAVVDTTATGKLITLVFEATGKTNNTYDVDVSVVSVLSQGTENVDPTETEVGIPTDVAASSSATSGSVAVTGYKAGSVDGNGVVDDADVVLLLKHFRFSTLYTVDYTLSLDFNSDGATDTADVQYLLKHKLFSQLYKLYP